jgi:hypothetical protein
MRGVRISGFAGGSHGSALLGAKVKMEGIEE